MVRELAAAAQTRPPDQIALVPMVNAAVQEHTKLLGLIGGRRRLYLGVPLLQALTVDQLRSVVAHELGHYSRRHTRLGEIAYRGRDSIRAVLSQLQGRFSGWLLRQYAKFYLAVSAAVSRRQELEADELSARMAGKRTAQESLRALPAIDAAWGFYEARYIKPGWSAGYAPLPEDFFRGFGELVSARRDQLAALQAAAPPAERSRYDTHPPIADRIAAIERLPETLDRVATPDPRPAWTLIPMFDGIVAAVAASSLKPAGRAAVPWRQFSNAGALAEEQRLADRVYRSAARFAGVPRAGLDTVLALSAQRRLGEFATEFFPNTTRREATQKFAAVMTRLMGIAAVRSGVASWAHPWSGQPVLVRPDGSPLDLAEIAALAVAPDTVGEAQARLAAAGIDAGSSAVVETQATAYGGAILSGMATVQVNGSPTDILILDNGLILIPGLKKADGGKARLLAAAKSAPLTELAKANTFIGLEDIARVVVSRRSPVRLEIVCKDGRTFAVAERWTSDRLTDEAADAFFAVVERFVAQPASADSS
jgi:Zn-dependent protease with chaperone function